MLLNWNKSASEIHLNDFTCYPICIQYVSQYRIPISQISWYGFARSGFALPVAIVARCEEKIFLAQKNFIWQKQVAKKILLPKNRHHLGCFMSFNRQLTSWITCLKSVADQLIHDDNNSPHCLQLLKRVKLFFFFVFFDTINFSWHLLIFDLAQPILGTLTFCEGPWDNLTLLQWYNLTQHWVMPLHDLFV